MRQHKPPGFFRMGQIMAKHYAGSILFYRMPLVKIKETGNERNTALRSGNSGAGTSTGKEWYRVKAKRWLSFLLAASMTWSLAVPGTARAAESLPLAETDDPAVVESQMPDEEVPATPESTAPVEVTATPAPTETPAPAPEEAAELQELPTSFSYGIYTCRPIDESTVYIHPNNLSLTTYDIPTQVSYGDLTFTVTAVSFQGCNQLEYQVLPETVTTLKSNCFLGCEKLTGVEMPGVTRIEYNAFYNCQSLRRITLPAGVTYLGQESFRGCTALETVDMSQAALTEIGSGMFRGCTALESVRLPAELTEIPTSTFEDCSSLTQVEMGDSVENIGFCAFQNCAALESIVLSDALTTIENFAFDGCTALRHVDFGTSLVSIGVSAFRSSSELEELIFPDTLTDLDLGAFQSSQKIKKAVIPGSLKSLNSFLLYHQTQLTDLTLKEGITRIENNALQNCTALTHVTLPQSLEYIGAQAFTATGIQEIVIPPAVTTIGINAFQQCSNLTTVDIQSTNLNIEQHAFYMDQALKQVTVGRPGGTITLAMSAFSNCHALTDVVLSEGVTEIGDSCFEGSQLTHLELPSTLTTIADEAFYLCWDMTGPLTIPGSVKTIGQKAFSGSKITALTIESGVESIGNAAFSGCSSLQELTLSEGLLTIGDSAFEENSLTKLIIPDSVESIGTRAFQTYNTRMDVMVRGEAFPEMGEDAFGNSSRVYLEADADVGKTFDDGVFTYQVITRTEAAITGMLEPETPPTTQVTRLTLPQTAAYNGKVYKITKIADFAFQNKPSYCGQVDTVVIPEGVTYIGIQAFYNWVFLEHLQLPDSLVEIGSNAFAHCDSLRRLILPAHVTTVRSGAFNGCEYLETVSLKGEMPANVENLAFPEDVLFDTYRPLAEGGTFSEGSFTFRVTAQGEEPEAAIHRWTGGGTEVTIPDTVYFGGIDYAVTAIGAESFAGSGVKKVEMSASIRTIEEGAFQNCRQLSEVNFKCFYYKAQLTEIGPDAFRGCTALTQVTLPEQLATVGAGAFADSGLTGAILVLKEPPEMGEGAFPDHIALELFNGLYYSGSAGGQFQSGNFVFEAVEGLGVGVIDVLDTTSETIVIPETATYVNSKGESYTYPVTWLGADSMNVSGADRLIPTPMRILDGTQATTLVIPDTVTTIGHWAFLEAPKLETIVLPDRVTEIHEEAFWHALALKEVVLPAGVTKLENGAFKECEHLERVTLYAAEPPAVGSDVFPERTTVVVPESALSAYQSASGWSGYRSQITTTAAMAEVDGLAYSIGDGKARLLGYGSGQGGRSTLTVPASITWQGKSYPVTSIGPSAFEGDRDLREVSLPGTITEIGDSAFFGALNLSTITLRTIQAPTLGGEIALQAGATVIAPEDANQASYSGGQWSYYRVKFTGDRVKPEPVVDLTEVHLAGGYEHSLAVRTDGTLWAWGSNAYGQLGDGTGESRDYPAQVEGLEHVAAVAAGSRSSFALLEDGTLWAWGDNSRGQLGDGTTTRRDTPVQILEDVAAVSAGSDHTLALKSDGTLWAWGDNSFGQLGDGTTTRRTAPVQILSGVTAISAGAVHSAAVKSDGTLWLWGEKSAIGASGSSGSVDDWFDQINHPEQPTPIQKASGVAAVSAGGFHVAYLTTSGSLYTLGENVYGELGDGTQTDRKTGVRVMDGVAEVSAGTHYTLARKEDGTLWSWGYIDRTIAATLSPKQIGQDFDEIAASSCAASGEVKRHSLAISGEVLYTWGHNDSGQLGDRFHMETTSPASIMYITPREPSLVGKVSITGEARVGRTFTASTSEAHADVGPTGTLSLQWLRDGEPIPGATSERYTVTEADAGKHLSLRVTAAWCEGSLTSGESEAVIAPKKVANVAVGTNHMLAVLEDGSLWAWGKNDVGQLGDGTTTNRSTPVKVMDGVVRVAAGQDYTLAILEDGSLWAWGANGVGQLGDGTTKLRITPVKIMDGVKEVSASNTYAAAVKTDGTLWCWGQNSWGLGDGTMENTRLSPVQILSDVEHVYTGFSAAMVLKTDGSLWGWGIGFLVTGDSSKTYRYPVPILSNTLKPSEAAPGVTHVVFCAEEQLYSKGGNDYGQVGDGTTEFRSAMVGLLFMDTVTSVKTGGNHNVAIKRDGSLWAWGRNDDGQVGNNTTEHVTEPCQVLRDVSFAAVGSGNTAAIGKDGSLWVWGDNSYGQLGNGTTEKGLRPAELLFLEQEEPPVSIPVENLSEDQAVQVTELTRTVPSAGTVDFAARLSEDLPGAALCFAAYEGEKLTAIYRAEFRDGSAVLEDIPYQLLSGSYKILVLTEDAEPLIFPVCP